MRIRHDKQAKVFCECGCGTLIPAINKQYKKARFAHGHNAKKPEETLEQIRTRFMRFVSLPNDNGCWLWIGTKHGKGYGQLRYKGAIRKAHRVSYLIFVGNIPDDLCVCHRCDIPGCVNPNHLWLGTNAENTADRDAKGRQMSLRGDKHWAKQFPEKVRCAERHHNSKLTYEIAEAIREERRRGLSLIMLAAKYKVTTGTISDIARGRTWTKRSREEVKP